MDLALKQRLVGAIVLIALAVIFLPMLLDGSGSSDQLSVGVEIPERIDAPESRFEVPDVDSELAGGQPRAGSEEGSAGDATDADSGSAEKDEPAVTGWVVQVGSFSRDANAIVLRDRLQSKGFPAFVSRGEADGQSVWRVQVGPVPEEAEAKELARKLEAERDSPALVMSYP